MKRAEKDKLVLATIIDSLLAIGFAILLYVVVRGYNTIPIQPTDSFVVAAGPISILLGVVFLALSKFRKSFLKTKYALGIIFTGAVLLLLRYGFMESPVGFGFHLYYSLLALTFLLIIGIIAYTFIRIRRG